MNKNVLKEKPKCNIEQWQNWYVPILSKDALLEPDGVPTEIQNKLNDYLLLTHFYLYKYLSWTKI